MSLAPTVKVVKSSDGTDIYAEAVGDSRHPHVILVHGLWLSAAVFDNLFSEKRLRRQVRYDLRGHGRSGMPTDPASYTSALFADDYAAVLQAFQLKSLVHVGWSYRAAIAVDVCAHISPNPIAGLVIIGALPVLVPEILGAVATPTVFSFQPGLASTTDVALSGSTKVNLVDALFSHPDKVDFAVKTSWLGQTALQFPGFTGIALSRGQDPAKLFKAGRQGLPLLILHGTEDKIMSCDGAVSAMKPHFSDVSVHLIQGGSHALFFEHQEEVVKALVGFVNRVSAKVGN